MISLSSSLSETGENCDKLRRVEVVVAESTEFGKAEEGKEERIAYLVGKVTSKFSASCLIQRRTFWKTTNRVPMKDLVECFPRAALISRIF